jgi:predicted DNA-binding transcriptional regulator AlpA
MPTQRLRLPAQALTKRLELPLLDERAAPNKSSRLLSKADVCDLTSRTFPTIWTWMQRGKFPRAVNLNGRPAWRESEVIEWIEALPIKKIKGDADV